MEPAVFAVKLQTKPSSAVVVSSTLVGDEKTEVGPVTIEKEITPDQWNQVQHFQVPLFSSIGNFRYRWLFTGIGCLQQFSNCSQSSLPSLVS